MFDELEKQLESWAKIDPEEFTNFQAMVYLRSLLIKDLGYETASKVAGFIKFNLKQMLVEDMQSLVRPLSKVIINLARSLEDNNFPEEVLLESAKNIILDYND